MDCSEVCSVIKPFGKNRKRPPGRLRQLYDEILVLAICAVPLPAGGKLKPHNIGKDLLARNIKLEMFLLLSETIGGI
jgi:hypothetical protein